MAPQQASTRDTVVILLSVLGLGASFSLYNLKQHRARQESSKHAVPDKLLQSPHSEELQLAVQLALKAGSNMVAYSHAKGTVNEGQFDLGIVTKGQPENFCTKVDVENEHLVMNGILKKFPNHKIIGEETVGKGAVPRLTEDPTWIIDPIDGTTNFAAGLPLCCVSIGLCVNQKPVVGVAYAPMTDELFVGVRGHGCYLNGIQLSSRRNEKHKPLNESVVLSELGYPGDEKANAQRLRAFSALSNRASAIRQLGSGVLDICYVAAGRVDAVYAGIAGEGWKPWDYCAGLVIALETGCAVEAIDQRKRDEFDIYSDSIICAVSQDLLEEIRQTISSL